MSEIFDAETLGAAIGGFQHAVGPVGFGIHYALEQGAQSLDPAAPSVTLKLDEPSLQRAHAYSETHDQSGRMFTQIHGSMASSKPSKSMESIEKRRQGADQSFANIVHKRKLDRALLRSSPFLPSAAGPQTAEENRASLAQQVSKNPMLRRKERHFLDFRRTCEQIMKFKEMPTDPKNLPQTAKERTVEREIAAGQKKSFLGHELPSADPQTGRVSRRAMDNARTGISPQAATTGRATVNSFEYWAMHGLLAGGSYASLHVRYKPNKG